MYREYKSSHPPFLATNGKTYGSDDNSYTLFRENRKRTTPSESDIKKIVDIMSIIDFNHYKYLEEFRQLYFYMWSGKTHMFYNEREESNLTKLIIDFYGDFIFVAIVDRNRIYNERHIVCDGIEDLENFINQYCIV